MCKAELLELLEKHEEELLQEMHGYGEPGDEVKELYSRHVIQAAIRELGGFIRDHEEGDDLMDPDAWKDLHKAKKYMQRAVRIMANYYVINKWEGCC